MNAKLVCMCVTGWSWWSACSLHVCWRNLVLAPKSPATNSLALVVKKTVLLSCLCHGCPFHGLFCIYVVSIRHPSFGEPPCQQLTPICHVFCIRPKLPEFVMRFTKRNVYLPSGFDQILISQMNFKINSMYKVWSGDTPSHSKIFHERITTPG